MIMTMMTISQKYHHHHHHHQHQNDNDLHITTRGRGCWRASVWEVWQPLPTPGAIWGNHLNHPIICSYKHYLNIFLYQNQSFVQLEETLAALEGSEHCLTFGSGSKPAASQNICCFSKYLLFLKTSTTFSLHCFLMSLRWIVNDVLFQVWQPFVQFWILFCPVNR